MRMNVTFDFDSAEVYKTPEEQEQELTYGSMSFSKMLVT